MDWQAFWQFFGGTALAITAVAALVRSLVTHLLSKDVETFKEKLQRQAFEHQVQYRRVDEIVAKSLAEVYGCLTESWNAGWDFVHKVPKDDDDFEAKKQRVREANEELLKCMQCNRINMAPRLWENTYRYCIEVDKAVGARWVAGDAEREQELGAAQHKMEEAVNLLGIAGGFRDAIVAAYQERLGITDESASKHIQQTPAAAWGVQVCGWRIPFVKLQPIQVAHQTPAVNERPTGHSPPTNA
jgi:hypothetical protein